LEDGGMASHNADPIEPGEPVNVLLVDDQEENLMAFGTILEDLGQNLVKARSGEEALRLLYKEDYAVILLDVRMPGMDGFEAAGYIRARARSRHIPIIFITAFDDTLDRIAKGYSIGAVDYIMKPVNPDILRSKVKVFVELAQKTRSLEREIRERRRIEEDLRATNRELEAFSYSVSHDLRGPLRAINCYGELLAESYPDRPLDDSGKDCLRRICDSTRQMNNLIEDLLAFSRLSREKIQLSAVNPADVLRESLSQIPSSGTDTAIEPAFPPVLGSRLLLIQVFANLLSNAFKFVPKGVKPVVRVRGETNGDRVRILIEDNGIGIDPEFHEKIFHVFERLNPASGYPGTGIGLAIVRRAMERMGGKAGVESALGRGSTFWVELSRPKLSSGAVGGPSSLFDDKASSAATPD
jgi:two-component system sensor histidine kinase/response regulator